MRQRAGPRPPSRGTGARARVRLITRQRHDVTCDAHSPELCAGAISEDHWVEVRGAAQQAALTMGAATRQMAGLYRCSADNGVGPPLLKHINVIVQGPCPVNDICLCNFLIAGESIPK